MFILTTNLMYIYQCSNIYDVMFYDPYALLWHAEGRDPILSGIMVALIHVAIRDSGVKC